MLSKPHWQAFHMTLSIQCEECMWDSRSGAPRPSSPPPALLHGRPVLFLPAPPPDARPRKALPQHRRRSSEEHTQLLLEQMSVCFYRGKTGYCRERGEKYFPIKNFPAANTFMRPRDGNESSSFLFLRLYDPFWSYPQKPSMALALLTWGMVPSLHRGEDSPWFICCVHGPNT